MATINSRRYQASNISASTSGFDLVGGRYAIQINGTWNSGSFALQRLSNDGSTYVQVSNYTANTYEIQDIPDGTYRLAMTGSPSAIYADIIAIAAVPNGG